MREYAKIAPQFWTGETGRKIRRLGPQAVAIALYLLTCPHANAFGMYYLPLGYMAYDVGMSPEEASEWLQQVCATGFCAYDEDAEVIWIRNMARFQIGEEVNPRDNRAKWIKSEWTRLPKNRFLQEFYLVYGQGFGLPSLGEERDFHSPAEAPSKPLRSLELEKELEKEENTNTASAPPLASPAAERSFVSSPVGGDGTEPAPAAVPAAQPEQAMPEPPPSPTSRRGKGKNAPPPVPEGEPHYRAKSGRYLAGKRLTSFERFWAAFAFAKGKAEAADAWLDIPQLASASPLGVALVDEICRAAELEAQQRIVDTARGKSPKWPQGWLNARRWEDYELARPSAKPTASQTSQSAPVPALCAPTPEELEENRQRGLRHMQQWQGERNSGPVRANFAGAVNAVAGAVLHAAQSAGGVQ